MSLSVAGFDVRLVVGDGLGDAFIGGIQVHDFGAKPLSRVRRIWSQSRRALAMTLSLQPDIVHFHDPELLPVAVKLAQKGIRVIYDAHEDVPRQILTKGWIPRFLRPFVAMFFEYYENRAVKKLSCVVAATPYIESRFANLGVRAVNINNYPMLEELLSVNGGPRRLKRICYIGCISRLRGIVSLVQALPLVPDVRLILCGNFSESALEAQLQKEPGWAQVDYLGHIDRGAVRRVMGESVAGVVTFLPAPNHNVSQPNKLFEYMSAELPVIASDFPLWQKIIDDAGCGICVNPESPSQIAAAIRVLLDSPERVEKMGRAGRREVLSKYNWHFEARRLVELYGDPG